MTRIHSGPSAVTKERQGKARGGTSLEADVEFPTREGIDGQPSRDIEDRDGTVDKGSKVHRDVVQLSSTERSSELFLREDGAQVLQAR